MAVNMLFETAVMTLKNENGTPIAQHLPVQVDTVNIPWNAEVSGLIPDDWFDIYTIGWTSPVPQRGQFLVDETSGTVYQVFGNPAPYVDHIEVRVTRYSGNTP
jgi:hypothetical protein